MFPTDPQWVIPRQVGFLLKREKSMNRVGIYNNAEIPAAGRMLSKSHSCKSRSSEWEAAKSLWGESKEVIGELKNTALLLMKMGYAFHGFLNILVKESQLQNYQVWVYKITSALWNFLVKEFIVLAINIFGMNFLKVVIFLIFYHIVSMRKLRNPLI